MEEEVIMFQILNEETQPDPWNKGKLCGQKRPLKLQEVWSIRFRLEMEKRIRDLRMDSQCSVGLARLSIPESCSQNEAPVPATVWPHRQSLGIRHRVGPIAVRDPFTPKD